MYIPDNSDAYESHEREEGRLIRIDRRLRADETFADCELPCVDVPEDYGNHRELYFEED